MGLITLRRLVMVVSTQGVRRYQEVTPPPKTLTTKPPEVKPPHIVFIMADDLGWYDVSYHGSTIKTPNIDQHAHEGVRLENYYVSSWDASSRLNFMTGRYRIHTGLYGDVCDYMGIGETTLAEKLRQSGYNTALVGKWHLGGLENPVCNPSQRGFDSFFGLIGDDQNYYRHRRDTQGEDDLWANTTVVGQKFAGKYSTHLFAREAQRIIRQHDTDTPLFLYLSFQAVHTPLYVPTQYEHMYNKTIKDSNRRIFAGMATCMDEAIGNVTETLKQKGLWENTVLIFSSDNGGIPTGGGSNWPLRGHKGLWYEGGIKAVGIVNSPLLPEKVRGTLNQELMHMTDWFKTLIHLARGFLSGTKPLDGYNQWSSISEGEKTKRKTILLNFIPGADHGINDPRISKYFDAMPFATIRSGSWKLLTGNIENEGPWTTPPELGFKIEVPRNHGNLELYNIHDDPEERNNLVDINKSKLNDMLKLLYSYSKTVNKKVRLS
ncbi:arylsulfatase B-like [Glandiceps talaboti]